VSQSKQKQESGRWLNTARDDLRAARQLLAGDLFAHAAFACQQAAEKAVKAVHFYFDSDPWGHSILRLLQALDADIMQDLFEQAKSLDKFYIPTRYPDALPGLIPSEAYTRLEAEQAVGMAEIFVKAAGKVVDQGDG
jgi:HEPN domain-containing protein